MLAFKKCFTVIKINTIANPNCVIGLNFSFIKSNSEILLYFTRLIMNICNIGWFALGPLMKKTVVWTKRFDSDNNINFN